MDYEANIRRLESENAELKAVLTQQCDLVEKIMVAMNANADKGEAAEAELAKLKQQPISTVLTEWKTGALTSDAAMAKLFEHYSSNPAAQPAQEPVALKHRLVKIHNALARRLGDTDPEIGDMTDAEVCEYMPVFWAAKEVADLIGEGSWDRYCAPVAQPAQEPTPEAKRTLENPPEPTAWGMPDSLGNIIETIMPSEKETDMKMWADQYSVRMVTADQMLQYAKDYHQAMSEAPCPECVHVLVDGCHGCTHYYASKFERRVRGEEA